MLLLSLVWSSELCMGCVSQPAKQWLSSRPIVTLLPKRGNTSFMKGTCVLASSCDPSVDTQAAVSADLEPPIAVTIACERSRVILQPSCLTTEVARLAHRAPGVCILSPASWKAARGGCDVRAAGFWGAFQWVSFCSARGVCVVGEVWVLIANVCQVGAGQVARSPPAALLNEEQCRCRGGRAGMWYHQKKKKAKRNKCHCLPKTALRFPLPLGSLGSCWWGWSGGSNVWVLEPGLAYSLGLESSLYFKFGSTDSE